MHTDLSASFYLSHTAVGDGAIGRNLEPVANGTEKFFIIGMLSFTVGNAGMNAPSQLLICVTIKERKYNAKTCWKSGIDPPEASINCPKHGIEPCWEKNVWMSSYGKYLELNCLVQNRSVLSIMSSYTVKKELSYNIVSKMRRHKCYRSCFMLVKTVEDGL